MNHSLKFRQIGSDRASTQAQAFWLRIRVLGHLAIHLCSNTHTVPSSTVVCPRGPKKLWHASVPFTSCFWFSLWACGRATLPCSPGVREGCVACSGQWNVSRSEVCHFQIEALRASVWFSLFLTWAQALCKERLTPSAWVLQEGKTWSRATNWHTKDTKCG